MKQYFIFLFLGCFFGFGQVKPPAEFIKDYLSQATLTHQVDDYFDHLLEQSNTIKRIHYGETYEGRALNAYVITSETNHMQLDEIRKFHLSTIGLEEQPLNIPAAKPIIWLSFAIHGNEIGSLESALSIAYDLVSENSTEVKQWKEDLIIILDPCVNPDGHSKYSNWLRQVSGKRQHVELSDREHMEPWAGGRQNHYGFDLNRDWAWQTQLESRFRVSLYNQWMPMVHVDVHEMGINEPYFFPPSAAPYHEKITDFQKHFHQEIGVRTSKKFDDRGWLYFSGERFDLFYPSYGDTYACFNGSVGMTYEQGGIGAGRAVKLNNGHILTLKDRVEHHRVAVLAAIELSYEMRQQLSEAFITFFKPKQKFDKSAYKDFQTYVVKNAFASKEFIELLNRNKINYSIADSSLPLYGYNYESDTLEKFSLESNDIVISVKQPKHVLTQVLMEPKHVLSDSLSYDITAWGLPLAHGLTTYGVKKAINYQKKKPELIKNRGDNFSEFKAYGYHLPWVDRHSVSTLGKLIQAGIQVRVAMRDATFGDVAIKKGGLVILKADNLSVDGYETSMEEILKLADCNVLTTGFSTNGNDLGGEFFSKLKPPKVLLLEGEGISNVDFGQIWHYFEEVIDYPISIVSTHQLNRIDLSSYTTIIMPSGRYNLQLEQSDVINKFVRNGGSVIALDRALEYFLNQPDYRLKYETKTVNENLESLQNLPSLSSYSLNERNALTNYISGAIVENRLDDSHPISFGIGEKYFSMKTSTALYPMQHSAENIMYVPEKYIHFGFIGHKIKDKLSNTMNICVENMEKGKVVYLVDNPLFRGFWEKGNLLFSNILFFMPTY